jgi:CMP-N-acetylneuraminic acid synthetase
MPPRLAAYMMPPERSVDIDTQADFDSAERLMRNAQGQRELLS